MKIQNVAVAGPNGNVGAAAIRHLLEAGFNVTALTRNPEKTAAAFPEVKVVHTEYESVGKLTETLKSCGKLDAVVCLIWRQEVQAQINLIDATIAADIPHYIPSSFGGDMTSKWARECPALSEKKEMEDHLSAKADAGLITFTAINIGMFLDWALEANFMVNVKDGGPVRIFDGGNVKVSVTLRDDAGKAVANALLKRDELINRFCYINSALVTQNQIFGYAKEALPEKTFSEVALSTDAVEKKSWESFRAGDRSRPTMGGFLLSGVFSGKNTFDRTDNDLLGIKMLDEQQLKAVVAKCVA